ncbi:MAG TPA: hypothetical protein VMT43_02935, partial [Acidimicrobiales bacterium]|nr:hypothetical protein [Acidimicrobiales bacterium]
MPDAPPAAPDTEADPYRLPRLAVPSRYELVLEPDLEAFTFTGTCRIDLAVTTQTEVLVLNAIELELTAASIQGADGTAVPAERVDHDEITERVTLHFPAPLTEGEWVLDLSFTGLLNDKLH